MKIAANFCPSTILKLKEAATVRGTIIASGVKRFRKSTRSMFECVFDDGTAHLHCRWWQTQPWMEDWYAVGREFLIFGKPDSLKPRNMDHPETEYVEPAKMNSSTSTASCRSIRSPMDLRRA